MGHIFSGLHRRTPHVARISNIFGRLTPPMIMSNLNKIRSFTLGGGICPIMLHPTYIFLFILCNHETHFRRCPVSKLTTHSPRMMNDHNHAPTPNTMQCPRAYEMQHVISCQITTCNIYKSWIIIFSTYNFNPSYIPC